MLSKHVWTRLSSCILRIKNSLDLIEVRISDSWRRPWYFTDMTHTCGWTQYIRSWASRLLYWLTDSLELKSMVTFDLSIQVRHTNLSHLVLEQLLEFLDFRISSFRSFLVRLHFVFFSLIIIWSKIEFPLDFKISHCKI